MFIHVAASVLALQMAASAAAPAPVQQPAPRVAADWAAPPSDKMAIQRAVRASIEAEKALIEAQSKQAAIPRPYSLHEQTDAEKYESFAAAFDDAKVPGCLSPQGLKRQSTLIFGGLLALPFIAVAKLRGKCN